MEEGDLDTFIVAVQKGDSEVFCFAADYLNNFPLWETASTTGWFDHLPGDDVAIVRPMYLGNDQRLVGWCSIEDVAREVQTLR